MKSFIGLGYHGTVTPPVILRNVLENPGWYTQYTPYQAEIAQGRLEALLNFQTIVADLTGLPLANASLLDEATAAAEAMGMSLGIHAGNGAQRYFIAEDTHPQTVAVVETRARPLGDRGGGRSGEIRRSRVRKVLRASALLSDDRRSDRGLRGSHRSSEVERDRGRAGDRSSGARDSAACRESSAPISPSAIRSVSESPWEPADLMPRFLATREEHARKMPGRIVGVSKDAQGKPAYRLALQTREQHIRRDKATSNICTAQVLLAIMASMYAVYHGPEGVRAIARRVHGLAALLAQRAAGERVRSRKRAHSSTRFGSG